jgi:lipopolysaccharide export system protein LptA
MGASYLNFTSLARSCLLSLTALPAAAELLPEVQPELPIIINANSSDFSYETRKLVFEGLRLDQGDFSIEANRAETDELDFNDGIWVFTGDVVFQTADATMRCETAELTFSNHELTLADMSGGPAWFEQTGEDGNINSGEASSIVYRLSAGTLELHNKAKFSDGTNKVSGDLITYDMQARHLRADAGSSGPVKIRIEPPERNKDDT